MKKRASINWGRWRREYKQETRVAKEIQKVSRSSKLLTAAAIIISILIASAALFINYMAGVRSSEKIEKSTMMLLDENKKSIQQTLNAINPNDFIFRLVEDGEWYTPASINEAAAFEWAGIPPHTRKALPEKIYLTMTGKTGRLTVRINAVSRIVFEFRLDEP